MKRNFKLIVALVVLAAMVLTLASCDVINGLVDKINPKPHEHTFSTEWSKDETHHWHAANCQDSEECKTQIADKAEHTYVDGKCVCGADEPACEHQYSVSASKEATCTEAGSKSYTCSVCGDSYTQEIPANGHSPEKLKAEEPTCTEPGLTEGSKCSVCDVILTAQTEINATGHSYKDGKCHCGEEDPDYIPPVVHVLNASDLEDKAKVDEEGFSHTITAGDDDFFTLFLAKKTKIEANDKTFADGVSASKRISWQTKTVFSADEITAAIKFTVNNAATVKVWWVSGGDGRTLAIYKADGTIVAKSTESSVKNELYVTELAIPEAGTYYLGNDGGSNNYYQISVSFFPAPKTYVNGTTTDTYCWVDKVTFTAEGEGKYTFKLPAGLGAFDAADCDAFKGAPYADFQAPGYDPEGDNSFTVELEAEETYEFYISAAEKKDWAIEWTYEACEVKEEEPPVVTVITTPLNIGHNEINPADAAFEFVAPSAANLTLTAGGAIQGDISFSYTVNGGEAQTLALSSSITLALEAGDKVVITVTATGYSSLTAAWDGETAGDDDDDEPVVGDSDLVVGSNSIVITDAILTEGGLTLTFVAQNAGTYTFKGDFAAHIYNANGDKVGTGSATLEAGTYTVNLGTGLISDAGTYTLTVEYTAPVTEPDGSESDPYVWDTLPESVTINSDTINMVYYLFTATQTGSITITWPTADSWGNWFEMNGQYTTENNGVSNETTTMVIPVEVGKTYRIGLGTYYVSGEFTLTITFGEGTTESTGTTYVGTDDFGNSPLTVVITNTTVTFTYSHPMMGSSEATYDCAVIDGVMYLYDENGEVITNPMYGYVTLGEDGVPVAAGYNGTDYTLALAGADDDNNTGDDNTSDDDTDEIVTSGTVYDGEENTVTITADDIEAGKVYLSFMAYQTGEYEFASNDLYISGVYTEDGDLLEMNDNYCYELEEYASYIVEINTAYLYSAGDYSLTPEYQYPQGHMNNPNWYFTIGETVTATCPGGYDAVWYQFYANETGTLTLSTEADGITLMLAGYPGYEIDNISYDDNFNAVYAKSLSLDVVKGRKYYLALAATGSETAVDVEFTVSIVAGEIETDGTVNVPYNIVDGVNTAAIGYWDSAWFMYKATANGVLTLSTTATTYGWYAVDAFGSYVPATTGDITWELEEGDIVYLWLENQADSSEISFTASFKADPTEAYYEGTLIADGSAANEIVIAENTYAGFQLNGTVGQFTITWDNANAVVKVNDVAIENGGIITATSPYWGPYFQISLPEYAAGTVNLTITPYEAPSQAAVIGDNTVSANGNSATPVKFTATEANTFVITIGTNAVVEYEYMNYFAGETIKITLGAGEYIKFNVYTEDYSSADVVINVAVAAPSVSGEYRYVDSEDWKHRWVLVLEDDGTGTIAEQTYDSDSWTWSDVSCNTLSYTFVKNETNYSITIDFADGCAAVDGTYVTGPVDDTTGIIGIAIGESTFDFFIYE